MRLRQRTFTVEDILTKVRDEHIDLQPSFQRGEVWPETKKKRLVDTVLRNWYIPPIHLVQLKTGELEVLDGQQRIRTLLEYHEGKIRVDGSIHPSDSRIQKLDGMAFQDLPVTIRNRFLRFRIKAIVLHEYAPEEPGELFFRLNQLSGLTPAEQRNAFYGTAKFHVKALIGAAQGKLFRPETLGFTNARLGYDDVVARVCFALEVGTHHRKVTSKAVENKYRSKNGFEGTAIKRAKAAIKRFADATDYFGRSLSFNKATLFSWLCFVAEMEKRSRGVLSPEVLGRFVESFESRRSAAKSGDLSEPLLLVFNDRASSRVADVTSVLARDFVLWSFWVRFCEETGVHLRLSDDLMRALREIAPTVAPPPPEPEMEAESALMNAFAKYGWGKSL